VVVEIVERTPLLDAIDRHLGDRVVALPSSAGLHTSVYFAARGLDTDATVTRARAAGVAIEPLLPYYQLRPRAGLALGYGMVTAANIEPGIRRLAASLRGG